LSWEWKSEGVMDDESGEFMNPTVRVNSEGSFTGCAVRCVAAECGTASGVNGP